MNQLELIERYRLVRDAAYFWGSLLTVMALLVLAGCAGVVVHC